METKSIKEEARRIIENLPDNSSWDDLMYQIYVRQAIEAGLKDSEEGRVVSIEQVRSNYSYIAQNSPQYAQRLVRQKKSDLEEIRLRRCALATILGDRQKQTTQSEVEA